MSDDTPATLREAAAEMRRNADMAEPGRWKMWGMQVLADPVGTGNLDHGVDVCTPRSPSTARGTLHTGNGLHMSGMDPTAARAIADLLDACADVMEDGYFDVLHPVYVAALRAARVYLRTPCPRCSRRDHNDPGDNMCPDDNGAARCAID